MTITASRNGAPQRKQLSDQLDRLDGIIDTLADGLTEAVRDAVTKGTATALQQVLLELVANPATRELLRQTLATQTVSAAPAEAVPETAAPTTRKASFLARCKRVVANAARTVAAVPGRIVIGVKGLLRKTKGLARRLNIAWQLKKAAVVGLGIGAAVATVAMLSHPLASVLSGVGAAATAFAVQLGLWCRGTARQLMS
jgi:hypothetical protein